MGIENKNTDNVQVLPSVCPLDCPDTCSLSVTVSNDLIIDVRGSHTNPYTAGVICAKVAKGYPDFVHGKYRLKTPMRRVGSKGSGEFAPISWPQALDLVHEGISAAVEKYGSESVVPFNYSGPHGQLAGGSMDMRFFHKLGASQLDRGPLCAGVQDCAFTSLYGDVPGMLPEEVAFSRLIVVWGANITVSNLHMQRAIKRARECGAKLVVIDPKRIKVAEQADLHLAIRPGTDVLLGWAIATELERLGGIDTAFADQWLLGLDAYLARAHSYSLAQVADICGVSEQSIRDFAEMYHRLSPASMVVGVAVERNRNGGSGVRAAAALPALAGKFGVKGGGLVFGASSAFPTHSARLQRPDLMAQATRMLNILDIPEHILNADIAPPVAALFIYNHNPLAVHPDQHRMRRALASESLFTVGCDVVMTDSLAYADVILPACSHFEHNDIYAAYGHGYLQRAEPVIPPVGESLPNTEIFRRLAARFGFDDSLFAASDETLMDEAFDLDDQRMNGTRPTQLARDQVLPMLIESRPPNLFENVSPATPSGKVELYSAALEAAYQQGLPSYRGYHSSFPLMLITPSSNLRTNATFGGSPDSDNSEWIEIHPVDAASRNLSNHSEVRVWNDLGEVNLRVKISDAVCPGVVCSPKGAWLRTSRTGQTSNALIAGHKSDIADGACYNDARVDVAPWRELAA